MKKYIILLIASIISLFLACDISVSTDASDQKNTVNDEQNIDDGQSDDGQSDDGQSGDDQSDSQENYSCEKVLESISEIYSDDDFSEEVNSAIINKCESDYSEETRVCIVDATTGNEYKKCLGLPTGTITILELSPQENSVLTSDTLVSVKVSYTIDYFDENKNYYMDFLFSDYFDEDGYLVSLSIKTQDLNEATGIVEFEKTVTQNEIDTFLYPYEFVVDIYLWDQDTASGSGVTDIVWHYQ